MERTSAPIHFAYGTTQSEIAGMRINYSQDVLEESSASPDPYVQFAAWMEDAKRTEREANAMCLSTATTEGRPSARIVLLKGYDPRGFVFYTNYRSRKATEILGNPYASLTFYWGERSVRVEGRCEKVSDEESEAYFASRPRGSQIGAWASEFQSSVLPKGREDIELAQKNAERRFETVDGQDPATMPPIPKPDFWGGFRVIPEKIEFWQGRPSRGKGSENGGKNRPKPIHPANRYAAADNNTGDHDPPYADTPVLVMGLSGYCAGTIILGLSTTFTTALVALFITGCFAGNAVVAKSMIGELGKDEKTRAIGYSAYGMAFGAAGILGTFLGGFLSDVRLFAGNEFLRARPSFLACLVGAMLAVVAIVVTTNMMKEVPGKYGHGESHYTALTEEDGASEADADPNSSFSVEMTLVDTPATKATTHIEDCISKSSLDEFTQSPLPPPPPPTAGSLAHALYGVRCALHPYISLISRTTIPPIALFSLFSLTNALYHTVLSLLVEAPVERGGYHLTTRDMAIASMMSSVTKLFIKAAYGSIASWFPSDK
ncbi:hypothetical protein HDU97_000997 [Phlyctochytrium planicorne]|nr:hypothetical protein HDU97_000997 [Phlyctochytrium planicorne]